jgi:mercuric ion transport protein
MENQIVKKPSKLPIIGALIAAFGASLCCAGPLVLILLGVSGSWIGSLAFFEPFKPLFIGLTIVFFAWGGWQLYKPVPSCEEGDACAIPTVQVNRRRLYWVALVAATVMASSSWWIPLLPESILY